MARERPRTKYLSPAASRALVEALDGDEDRVAAAAILFLLATGCRKGEALAARWEHIDLVAGHWHIPDSKTGQPRDVPLSRLALRALEETWPLAQSIPGCSWAFPSMRRPGRPVQEIRSAWVRAKTMAGIESDFRLHDLRHTFASLLVNQGHTLYDVGQILGHRRAETTSRYAHLTPARQRESAELVARLIVGGG
jgi:integrase